MLITISGPPGSGTTTASRIVAHELGLEHVYAGQIFRRLAVENNMTLEDFGKYAEEHAEVDWELDRRMVRRARKGGCVLEGRLTGWMVSREKVTALRVYLQCPEDVRASRVAEREGLTKEKAMRDNRTREASEGKRYQDIYQIDVRDLSPYDLVVDSDRHLPEEIAAMITAAARQKFPS